jgi:nucleotide-binding universal stress UspA family protein
MSQEAVVQLRRYLVVANQTLHRAELQDELRKRISAGPSSFYVLVPNTKAAHYDAVAVGNVLPEAGMWWWVTDYAPPKTDAEATAAARERLNEMLHSLAEQGVPVESSLGSSSPLEAMQQVLADHEFDEIIVATLPQPFSRWLGGDLPRQAERRFGLPVTTIITER